MVEAVLIVFALLAVGLLIRNILGLCAVKKLLADSKAERLLKIKAVVKWSVPARIGSSRAAAEYSIGERKIKGRMIGASRQRLTEEQTVKVLVSERKPGFFAMDERQIKNAISAYAAMCLVFLITAAFLIFIAAERIISG